MSSTNNEAYAHVEDVTRASKIKLVLNLETGSKLYGWPQADGQFAIHNVPEGTHLLDVNAIGLVYPQVRKLMASSAASFASQYYAKAMDQSIKDTSV